MRDPMTGIPKCFGFVVFKEIVAVEACLQNKGNHILPNGKNADVK